ncbi:GNAT family N-acetyltransferase [Rummeliibacillus sp. G93]|uniref:GNAT family N-acetyltransferase n=1 Tax=Rummeliibacillus sp. G93 TaxID=2939494 RepID=UPI00201BD077|nr:GNAT family N-acetyltransferase [Rummeliibacillus sp. G93]UQW96263.1 GNAT family N-acetyltransferase [Rummeliibacillus sp. G93]
MLESKRTILVKYTEDEMGYLEKLLSNPNMVKYIGNGKVRSREQTQIFFNWIVDQYNINENYGLKIIKDKTSSKNIGHAGLVPQIVEGKEFVEVGYWIEENYWGKGYASEIAQSLITFGLQVLKLPEIIALIQKENIASEKVALKNGMKKEKEIMVNGKIVNLYKISLKK